MNFLPRNTPGTRNAALLSSLGERIEVRGQAGNFPVIRPADAFSPTEGEGRDGREQFYVSASRFKEALTIYTDDKHQLLESVRKSSHRPSATDLVTKEISEAVNESAETPSLVKVKNEQEEISETQKFNWPHKQKVRQSQSRGIGV